MLSTLLYERDLSGKAVLELGSGTGVGGLTAAAAGASSVLLTDGSDAALELLQRNVASNGETSSSLEVARMYWGDEDDTADVASRGPFDLVIGSDLLYAAESFPHLLDSLAEVCVPDETEVLLTYPTRHTESIFHRMAEEYGFEQLDYEEEVEPSLWAARLVLRA